MNNVFKRLMRDQRGLVLIELTIAVALAGIITGGITMTIFQVFNMNTRSSNHMIAVRQVQNAGHWVSHDAQMAHEVDTESEFLKLTWTIWDTGDVYEVIYTLQEDTPSGLKKLQRKYYINSILDGTAIVARNIDPGMTTCEEDIGGVLTFMVKATVSEQSETREYKVVPRPDD